MDITLRAAREDDAEALLSIYAPYVTDTAISFEYTVPSLSEFRQRIRNTLMRYPYIVAVTSDTGGESRIVGYAYASPFHERAAYAWTAETSIYVSRDFRSHGVGTALYRCLEDTMASRGIRILYACVACTRESNDPYLTNASYAFHIAHGYREVGRFQDCGLKFGRWYDMTFLEKRLIGTENGIS